MNKIYLTLLFFVIALRVQAQVGYGTATPDKSAAIEIQASDKGILVPRINLTSATQKLNATANNANALLVFNTGTVLSQGFYYWKAKIENNIDNGSWIALGSEVSSMPKFFYMPSIVISTATNGTGRNRNLYAEYKAQFTGQLYNEATETFSNNPDFVKNPDAPALIPNIPIATGLYYYITDYDKTALDNLSISNDGVLTYDVIGSGTDYSFVNIVFVVK